MFTGGNGFKQARGVETTHRMCRDHQFEGVAFTSQFQILRPSFRWA